MIWIAVALLGLIVGSFLNVCIYRVPLEKSVVTPRSACPSCGKPIAFYDNVPVLSYLVLGGKCRQCKASISWQYPVVEALNAAGYLAVYAVFGLTVSTGLYAAFTSAMITLSFIDARHRILPHGITFGGLALGLATAPWQALHQAHAPTTLLLMDFLGWHPSQPLWASWFSALLGLLMGAGLLLLVAVGYYLVRKEEGMGHGDIVMMGFVGAVLGWQGTLLTIFLGSFLGAVAGLILIRRSGGDRTYQIPFGTFLGLASVIALLSGDRLLNWYWNLF